MAVSKADKIYVALQIVVILAWFYDIDSWQFRLSENMHALSLIFALTGLLLVLIAIFQMKSNLSPFPSPTKGTRLLTGGVFAFARHPIYSGLLFMGFGFSVWLGSGFKVSVSLLLLLVLYFKSRYEEQRLEEAFSEYPVYKKNTGRFFPKFKGRI